MRVLSRSVVLVVLLASSSVIGKYSDIVSQAAFTLPRLFIPQLPLHNPSNSPSFLEYKVVSKVEQFATQLLHSSGDLDEAAQQIISLAPEFRRIERVLASLSPRLRSLLSPSLREAAEAFFASVFDQDEAAWAFVIMNSSGHFGQWLWQELLEKVPVGASENAEEAFPLLVEKLMVKAVMLAGMEDSGLLETRVGSICAALEQGSTGVRHGEVFWKRVCKGEYAEIPKKLEIEEFGVFLKLIESDNAKHWVSAYVSLVRGGDEVADEGLVEEVRREVPVELGPVKMYLCLSLKSRGICEELWKKHEQSEEVGNALEIFRSHYTDLSKAFISINIGVSLPEYPSCDSQTSLDAYRSTLPAGLDEKLQMFFQILDNHANQWPGLERFLLKPTKSLPDIVNFAFGELPLLNHPQFPELSREVYKLDYKKILAISPTEILNYFNVGRMKALISRLEHKFSHRVVATDPNELCCICLTTFADNVPGNRVAVKICDPNKHFTCRLCAQALLPQEGMKIICPMCRDTTDTRDGSKRVRKKVNFFPSWSPV